MNPYVNNVQLADGTTLMDIRSTTAVASDVKQGKIFFLATGEEAVGTGSGSGAVVIQDENGFVKLEETGDAVHLQAKTGITPTEQAQTIVPDTGFDGMTSVGISAIPSSYIGSGVDRRSSSDLIASGATVNVPAGYYAEAASKAVSSGSAGTPTATKGTVSNHSVSVTPSVSNTSGYISGGAKTGTAVTVSASELVSGNKEITANGTGIDVANYSTVSVAVSTPEPNLQAKTASPTESSQTIQPDSGYDGLSSVQISGISSTYVGSDVTRRSSSDLTASGATVTVPAGYYASQASKAVASGSATTPATTVTANPTISVSSSGLITASVSGSKSVTPTVSAGYVSAGTAGTVSVSGSKTQQLTTKAAATITPGTTAQTIASGTYLTGTQTIAGDSNLVSGNILSGKSIFGVQGGVSFQTYYTGSSAPSSSLGVNGDIYLQT